MHLALACSLASLFAAPATAQTLLIENAAVLSADGSEFRSGRSVLVEDGRITAVAAADAMPPSDAATVVDGAGGYLIPGLIDLHAHLLLHPYDEASWGVIIACGSDAGVFDHGDNAGEIELMAAWGMGPVRALQAATTVAARVLQKQDELGAIAPGRRADLVLLAADPHRDVSALRQVRAVVAGGRLHRVSPR